LRREKIGKGVLLRKFIQGETCKDTTGRSLKRGRGSDGEFLFLALKQQVKRNNSKVI